MTRNRVLTAAVLALLLGASPAVAQELSRYRGYTLGTSVAAVVTTGGVREGDIKTLHTRPAKIQQVEWRAPWAWSGSVGADPVHDVVFSFYDDRLYEITVTYDRDRMAGLTSADVIGSVSATYGPPVPVPAPMTAKPVRGAVVLAGLFDAVLLARWENEVSLVTLTRFSDTPRFQLVLVSKALDGPARAAIKEAVRLDAVDAPQRELELRNRETAAALLKSEQARAANMGAFRP